MLSDGAGQVKLFLVTMARVPHLRAFLPFSSSVQSTVPIFPIFSLRCMPWWTPSGTSLPTLASPAPVIPAGLNYLTSHGHCHSVTTWCSTEVRAPAIQSRRQVHNHLKTQPLPSFPICPLLDLHTYSHYSLAYSLLPSPLSCLRCVRTLYTYPISLFVQHYIGPVSRDRDSLFVTTSRVSSTLVLPNATASYSFSRPCGLRRPGLRLGQFICATEAHCPPLVAHSSACCSQPAPLYLPASVQLMVAS